MLDTLSHLIFAVFGLSRVANKREDVYQFSFFLRIRVYNSPFFINF